MKKITTFTLFLSLLLCYSEWGLAQSHKTLSSRIQSASVVVEGKIIHQESFWNNEQTMIFTRNTIEVNKVFKGNPDTENLHVITKGGQLDGKVIKTSERTFFPEQSGVFLLKSSLLNGYSLLEGGFIRYDKLNKTALDVGKVYTDIEKDVYDNIHHVTGKLQKITEQTSLFWEREASNARFEAPEIETILPLEVTAGTQTKITINGSGFGDFRGQGRVSFSSYDQWLGESIMQELYWNGDYVSWSDSKIVVYVPSFAVSGEIAVITDRGETFTSFEKLDIPYALSSITPWSFFPDPFGGESPSINPYFSSNNTSGGYTIFVDPQFYREEKYLNALVNALNNWRCATGINIKISANQAPIDFFVSGKSVISIIEDEFDSPSYAYSEYEECNTGTDRLYKLKHFRLFLSINNATWSFGDTLGPDDRLDADQLDFETEITRQLGRLSQLEYVNNPNDLMHFSLPLGETRSISDINKSAANILIEKSKDLPQDCEWLPMELVNGAECENSVSLPEARFSAVQTEFCNPGETIVFENESRNATSWFWEFEGGEPATSRDEHPKVSFKDSGVFSIKLTVSNPGGEDSEQKEGYIKVGTGSEFKVDLGDDQLICQGDTYILDTGIDDAEYEWSNGATSKRIEVTREGTYEVIVKKLGCEASDEVTITFNKEAKVDAGSHETICGGEEIQLAATRIEGATYVWSPTLGLSDPTISNPIARPIETTIYTVTVNTGTDCGTVQDSLRVTVGEAPVLEGFPLEDTISFCGGEGWLNAWIDDRNAQFEWSTGDRWGFINIFEEGEYWVKVTTNEGCTISDTVYVEFVEELTTSVSEDTTVCIGSPVQLEATGGQWYFWEPMEGLSDPFIANPIANPEETTVYSVTIGSGSCEPIFHEIMVEVIPEPFLDLAFEDTLKVCEFPYFLNAGKQRGKYEWSDGSTESFLEVTEAGKYFVSFTPDYCTDEVLIDSVVIEQIEVEIILEDEILACEGDVLVLSPVVSNSRLKYEWSDGSSEAELLVKESGLYSVTIFDECEQEYTAKTKVTFIELETPFEQDTIYTCQSEYILDAQNYHAQSYLWSNDSTSQSIEVRKSGLYSLSLVNYCGEELEDEVVVIFHEPVLEIGDDTTKVCEEQLLLSANISNAMSYLWSDGSTGETLLVENDGLYELTMIDSCGNELKDSTYVIFNQLNVELGDELVQVCSAPYTLDAGNLGATFLWSDGSTEQTLEVLEDGEYFVTVTDTCGTVASDTIQVIFHKPELNLGADEIVVCEGPVLLDAGNNGATYLWSNGSTEQSISVNEEGEYSVTVIDSCGFELKDTVQIIFDQPTLDLGQRSITICEPSTTLDAGNAGSVFKWSNGSEEQTIEVSEAGTYIVEVFPQGCSFVLRDTIDITFSIVDVDLGADTIRSCGETVLIDAGNEGATHLWSDGSTSSSISVNESGIYKVTVSNACGDNFEDSVVVIFPDSFTLDLGEDNLFVCDDTKTLDAGIVWSTYAWSTGETTPSIEVTEDGEYEVRVTDHCGNTFSDKVSINFFKQSIADFTFEFQGDGSVNFTNSSTSTHTVNYHWDFGDETSSTEVNPIHIFNRVGEYTVKLTMTSVVCNTTLEVEKRVNIVIASVGEDLEKQHILVYPNPAYSDFVNVQWTGGKATIRLMNIIGKTILTEQVLNSDGEQSLDITHLSKGVYLIELSTDKYKVVKRFIKE